MLVLGGTPARRLAAARELHDQGPLAGDPFVVFDCVREEARLARALESWLVENGGPGTATETSPAVHGVVYLESFTQLSGTTRRLLLMVAHRLQGRANEPGPPGPVRLMAGERSDVLRASDADPVSSALVDHFDKIRIEIGRVRAWGAA